MKDLFNIVKSKAVFRFLMTVLSKMSIFNDLIHLNFEKFDKFWSKSREANLRNI